MGINITKEGPNKWLLDVRVKKDGQEIRKRETFSGTKNQAEERFLDLKREIKGQGASSPSSASIETLGDALRVYAERKIVIPDKEKGRFERLQAELGPVPIRDLSGKLENYLKLARQFPSPKTKRLLSNGSINKLLILIKAALNLAVRMEYLDRNPITNARFPRLKEVPRDKVLGEQEIGRLFDFIKSKAPHLEAIVRFAIQVPCRKSELIHMRREDLDLIHNAIRVRNGTTKNDEGCWKPVPPDMVAYFRAIPPICPWLFYRVEKGQFLPLGDFKKAWAKCKQLAGIKDFRFHDTRHISATNLLDNGTPEQVVMSVAGWKTNMLKTYYHRSGKKSLALVNFSPGSGHQVDTHKVEAARNGVIPLNFGISGIRDSA
jgi:integrase